MNVRAMLEELEKRDVILEVDGERLHVDAPAGVLTAELRSVLLENKRALMKLLRLERRGLIIRWSEYPVWIGLYDPHSGEWHEVKASECLPSIVESAEKHRREGRMNRHDAP